MLDVMARTIPTLAPAPTPASARRVRPIEISVIVPTFNERDNLGELIRRIGAALVLRVGHGDVRRAWRLGRRSR